MALLNEDGSVLAEQVMPGFKGHFGDLMPAIDRLFRITNSTVQSLCCLAVATGPGSFTGLRVGIAVAKAFCHARRIPIVGIPSLEAMAYQIPYARYPVAPILASRKGEAFTAVFEWKNEEHLVQKTDTICLKLSEFCNFFKNTVIFIGNDFPNQGGILKQVLGEKVIMAPSNEWHLKASAIGRVAINRGIHGDFDDPMTLAPIYFRPPDIRPNPYFKNSSDIVH